MAMKLTKDSRSGRRVAEERRRRAQDDRERARLQDALAVNEATLRLFIQHTPAAVAMVDREMRYLLVSRRWNEVYDLGSRDLTGLSHYEVFPEILQMPHWMSYHRRALHGEVLSSDEDRFVRADGTVKWNRWELRPWRLPDGEIGGIMLLTEDITARKLVEEDRQRLTMELRRSNEELERFAFVSSHDLQEPLRMVAMYADLLDRRYRGRLDADGVEFLSYVLDGADRMKELINGLLAYAKLNQGGDALTGPVDMNALTERTLFTLKLLIEESQARVETASLPAVSGGMTQIGQVLQNLIANAIKFRRKGVAPRVRIEGERCGDRCVFSVADNGIGIPPEAREEVFEMFRRLNGQGEYSGAGIGLALCRKIVERYGGRIWVEASPGPGSVLRFSLPAAL